MNDRTARIAWSLISDPTDSKARELRSEHGLERSLQMLAEGTADPGQISTLWVERLAQLDVDDVVARSAELGMRILVPGDREWPEVLDDLGAEAPLALWAVGPGNLRDAALSSSVAIVGSRASTPYGEQMACQIARDFAARGGTVVSGGAYGIDAAAHRGALAGDGGATIAVLAGGLDNLYPRGNARLLETIGERGLLVSEYAPGAAPTRWRFLSRNRLVAALSRSTLLVEASMRSGSMDTVSRAESLGRPVGAVPGPLTSPTSVGPNELIHEGRATLVREARDLSDLSA